MSLVFVDCEAWGGCPRLGQLTEFGAAVYPSRLTFHGVLVKSRPSTDNPAVPEPTPLATQATVRAVFGQFADWLVANNTGRPVFVSDNPAYDWQWINDGFLWGLGTNPFGHSGRRISDYYAGLINDWHSTQKWKALRVTPHDHHPVHDALGNLEAWERLQRGER